MADIFGPEFLAQAGIKAGWQIISTPLRKTFQLAASAGSAVIFSRQARSSSGESLPSSRRENSDGVFCRSMVVPG
jgi:hypothetical protein